MLRACSDRRRVHTGSSSDSGLHTHSARRPSAADHAREGGGGLPHPLAHSDTQSLLRDCDGRLLSLSLSHTHGWKAGSSSLADVEKRRGEAP